ncbi:uncharacterized protein LOC120684519 [Panicum virgatum]|uniref:Uncharacterized protein n=1 Tax=Panicum virgatum TaxID=38727 RepID=A0A8T0P541_PANVG|nr:uncharacterized protein LOC120684519 [Panicum virgatum]KAG2556108.1 hypothetical protein PVAP13_8NG060200 [Panicum virgatum]
MAASELKLMEEIKRTAVDYFFQGVDKSQEATYGEIKSMAGHARCCYNDTHALRHITNDEFAEIMLVDGCFLVQFIDTLLGRSGDASFRRLIHPHTIGVLRDMMLLENQIPWAVMEVLMPLKSLKVDDVIRLLVDNCLHGTTSNTETEDLVISIDKDYKPSHLLCLIRFFEAAGNICTGVSSNRSSAARLSGKAVPIYTSAAELAELGIDLEASRRRQFSAMAMEKGPSLFAKLFLAPLNLDATIYCWLVNMAAFEMWTETAWEDCSVNSYLSVLSLLMHREEDVRELRVKRIVHGTSSDRQALEFFKDLAPGVSEGNAYWRLIGSLEEYRQKRWLWIAIYRFVYKNSKTIATVLSTVGVLVGIFKALLSLKQQPAAY